MQCSTQENNKACSHMNMQIGSLDTITTTTTTTHITTGKISLLYYIFSLKCKTIYMYIHTYVYEGKHHQCI